MIRLARPWWLLLVATGSFAGCVMPEAEYIDLLTQADSAMTVKQDHLQREFRLDQYPRFDYDEGAGILVFSDNEVAQVLADIQFVGAVSRSDSTWHWAWDLPYVSASLAAASGQTRRYGWLHGIPRLRKSGWHGDSVDGWEMTSLAAWISGAEGAYRAPSSDSSTYTFMLLRNVRWAPAGRTVDSYLISPRASP